MRVLWVAFGGSVIGAFAGLTWFLAILLMSCDGPDDFEGGAGPGAILLGIAGGFTVAGGVVGGLLGLLLLGIDKLVVPSDLQAAVSRMTVASDCPRCGRHVTPNERAVSALCPGCREPLPLVPRKTGFFEL
jgi:hypothetical protein